VVRGKLASRGKRSSRALRLLCLLFAAWTGTALAQTYLILSLVGDRLTIVTAESQVGSNLDRNRQEIMQLSGSGLDDFAARIAAATIAKIRPSASVITLRAADPSLYTLRNAWIDTDSIEVQALISLVAKLVPASPDAHLLLIAPRRDELELKTARDYRGSGSKVAGLGFYLDKRTRMWRSDTGETATGFLGIFANFQLVLIDMQKNAVEAQERAVVGTTASAARAADKNPWNALSQEEKIKRLESLMKSEIERLLPQMLGSPKP
jgi:hypothetical protein